MHTFIQSALEVKRVHASNDIPCTTNEENMANDGRNEVGN